MRAQKMLASAERSAPEHTYHVVRDSIMTYFADRLNTDARTIQLQEIELAMARHDLDERLQAQLVACLTMVDESLYAPFEAASAAVLVKNCAKLLAAVDARWKP